MSEGTKANKSETAKREEEVLAFWRENKTFERSLEKDAPKGEFVFYDGPPFATGLPHHGSLLSSIIKDVIPRYKTMRGFRVRRRWGWDTHGLPIENLVEKELGLATKKDIEKIGIAKFNETARSMVLKYVEDWRVYVERVGRWVDYDNSYKTMDNSFIESVWWALKRLWEKELLYEGRKVLMYCTHCETPLAKAEIAADNTYKDITEEAVTVRFKVRNSKGDIPNGTALLAWTTTPWTLPGNVALAVGNDIDYVLAQQGGESFVVAKNLMPADATVIHAVKGSELVGLEYEPLFDIKQMQTDTSHRVYAADFVSTDDGTGIVHTAVMYGEDDFALGQKERLPMVQLLNPNGTYLDIAPEFIRGKYIKDAEREIKKDLETRGRMWKRENNTHSYPHCWRCGTALIYNAVPSWFINVQKIKETMLAENEKVNWVPDHLKHGRFMKIMESAPDWTISRNRFWASPLPIWKSKEGKVMVVGSVDEIKQRVKKSGNTYFVMRHGRADNNVQDIVSSDRSASIHLTEEGKEKAKASAVSLGAVDYIYASPFVRTRETAEIVAEVLGVAKDAIVFDDRLVESNFGNLSGKSISEYHAMFPDKMERFSEGPEGGETYTDIRRRMMNFVSELEKKHSGKKILIISHGTPLWLLNAGARGLTDEETLAIKATEYPEKAVVKELSFASLPWNADYAVDLHRPYTDSIVLIGDDGAEYTRIPEVVDCWVESGSMPFAEYHYPFENKGEFEKRSPGDFIAEYIAQTRTWFYYMHVMGVALFDRYAFKNVVSTGTIVAADGQKISKSKKNYTDPLDLINQYGSDAMRLYLMSSPVMQAEDLRFRDEDVRDAHNRTIGILWNTFKFFDLYQKDYDGKADARKSEHVLDRWVLARLDETVEEVTAAMDAYDTPRSSRAIRAFVDEYSTWYVRRSRDRMKSEWHDKQYSLATQREVLRTLAKLMAPITPFIAESIWRGIEAGGSVHLENWPTVEAGFLSRLFGAKKNPVLDEMAKVRTIVTLALQARDKAGIKVRQPLSKLTIKESLSDELLEVIRDEVNVKGVHVSAIENEVELDTTITPELKEEGFVRDLIRAVQGARKEAGLNPGEDARVTLAAAKEVQEMIARHTRELQEATHTTIAFGDAANVQKIGEHEVAIALVS